MSDGNVMTPFSSRVAAKTVTVTARPNPSPAAAGAPRLGEGIPPGVLYPTYLREWPNKSQSSVDNAGPESPSANATVLPEFDKARRKTGR